MKLLHRNKLQDLSWFVYDPAGYPRHYQLVRGLKVPTLFFVCNEFYRTTTKEFRFQRLAELKQVLKATIAEIQKTFKVEIDTMWYTQNVCFDLVRVCADVKWK